MCNVILLFFKFLFKKIRKEKLLAQFLSLSLRFFRFIDINAKYEVKYNESLNRT